MQSKPKPSELVEFYQDMGVDEMIAPMTLIDKQVKPAPKKSQKTQSIKASPAAKQQMSFEQAVSPNQQAEQLANSCKTREDLYKALEAFEGCDLKKTATNMVFSDGQPDSKIMVIGEAPGADEDLQGKPFVGRSGQLLDRIFNEIGLSRKENLYISNILFWRPPGNRTPTRTEISMCRPFVLKHIELIDPQIILLVGGTALKGLLQSPTGIMKMRGKWASFGEKNIPTLPIFHPAFLLRSPAQKRFVWHDMLLLKDKIKELNLI